MLSQIQARVVVVDLVQGANVAHDHVNGLGIVGSGFKVQWVSIMGLICCGQDRGCRVSMGVRGHWRS